jgi:hypothetical protein
MEASWSKRRILEVYLNVAEFGEGLFGVEAAAWHYFGVSAADLSDNEAARLAAALPAPKLRDPGSPSEEHVGPPSREHGRRRLQRPRRPRRLIEDPAPDRPARHLDGGTALDHASQLRHGSSRSPERPYRPG